MNSIDYEWCIGRFEGDVANYVLGLANEGMGYFIRKTEGHGKGLRVEAAFRRAKDGPRSEACELAMPQTAEKLEEIYKKRHGRSES